MVDPLINKTLVSCILYLVSLVLPKTHLILSGNTTQTSDEAHSLVLVMDEFADKFDCNNSLINRGVPTVNGVYVKGS